MPCSMEKRTACRHIRPTAAEANTGTAIMRIFDIKRRLLIVT